MKLSNLLILFLVIPLIISQGGFTKSFADATHRLKKHVSQVSLIGKWRLLQDSNFVINKKIQMINDVSNQRIKTNDKLSFISSVNDVREAEAYFDSQREGEEPKALYIELYDGKYYLNTTVALEIELAGMESSRRTDGNINLWANNKTAIVVCMLIRNREVVARISVQAKIEIYTNAKEADIQNENSRFFVKFQSSSFSFYVELQYIKDEYNKLAMVQGFFTCMFLFAVYKYRPKRSVYNISEWMILQAFCFVIVASWLFLRVSLEKIDTKLRFVGLCAFVNVALVFFFLRNYEEVLKSFKETYHKIFAGIGVITYFVLCYYFENYVTFWIFEAFLLLILQISYSYLKGGKGGLSLNLVITIGFMRFPFFYYKFYCPEITRQPVRLQQMGTFLIVNAALLAFISMQRYFGSRFMIPKELIPDYFNYFHKLSTEDKDAKEVCPICTLMLKEEAPVGKSQPDDEDSDEDDKVVEESMQQNVPPQTITNFPIMKTPCNHMYHPGCLQEWMDKRLICPYCRTSIPPSQRQRDDSYCC